MAKQQNGRRENALNHWAFMNSIYVTRAGWEPTFSMSCNDERMLAISYSRLTLAASRKLKCYYEDIRDCKSETR